MFGWTALWAVSLRLHTQHCGSLCFATLGVLWLYLVLENTKVHRKYFIFFRQRFGWWFWVRHQQYAPCWAFQRCRMAHLSQPNTQDRLQGKRQSLPSHSFLFSFLSISLSFFKFLKAYIIQKNHYIISIYLLVLKMRAFYLDIYHNLKHR